MDVFVESTGKQEALKDRETSSNRMEAPWELRMLPTHRVPCSGVRVVCFHSVQASALLVTVRYQSCVGARA